MFRVFCVAVLLTVGCDSTPADTSGVDTSTSSTTSVSQDEEVGTLLYKGDVTVVVSNDFVGVIKPLNTPICNGQQHSTWVPTPSQASRASNCIFAFLETNAPIVADCQDEYFVQYLGIDTPEGRRLYCNFLHANDINDEYPPESIRNIQHLLTDYVSFPRHGFIIYYDPEGNRCSDFQIAPLRQ